MTDTTLHHVGRIYAHSPLINLDEIQFQRVCALGHVEHLFYVVRKLRLGVVTATHVAVLTACCDGTAVPALEIIRFIEGGGDGCKIFDNCKFATIV